MGESLSLECVLLLVSILQFDGEELRKVASLAQVINKPIFVVISKLHILPFAFNAESFQLIKQSKSRWSLWSAYVRTIRLFVRKYSETPVSLFMTD